MSKQETLIEKLDRELARNGRFNNWDLVVQDAIDIVKEHSDWVSVDERLPHAEEMLTNHYNPKEFYEIILKTGELLITSFTHLKNDGNNEIVFMDCTITLIDGEWKLLDDGCDVYEVGEVAYWKQIHPPSEDKFMC